MIGLRGISGDGDASNLSPDQASCLSLGRENDLDSAMQDLEFRCIGEDQQIQQSIVDYCGGRELEVAGVKSDVGNHDQGEFSRQDFTIVQT